MFEVNEYIVCGGNGVCKVIDIGIPSMSICDTDNQYYKLEPIYENGSTLYIPVNNEKVVMRKILSKDEVNELIKDMDSIDLLIFDNEREYEQKYKEIMRKYDCKDLIKIIKTSYLRKKERLAEGKKGTTTDEKYLKMAEDYLYGEFAIALNIPKEDVKDFIEKEVKKYA